MISIIIPFYNDSEHLPHTLGSCLMQDVDVEVIIVNDCSSKLCLPEITGLIDVISDEYIINSKNLGLAESRDAGISKAKGEFILPLDTQDYLYPNVLGKMLKAIQGYDVVYGNMTEYANGKIHVPPGKDGITLDGMKKINQLWCTSLFRKSIWEKVGGYTNGLHTSYEDMFFWNKCFMAGAKFKYINITIYNHTPNPNSMLSQLHNNTDYYNELAKQPLYKNNLIYEL